MFNAKPQFREYYTGCVYLINKIKIDDEIKTETVKKKFKYALVSENAKEWSMPVRNLISNRDNVVIKTSWNLPFKINQQVILNGEQMKIVKCTPLRMDLNEQVARMWKTGNIYWLIEAAK